jgi:hypothetical protein
VGLDASSHWDTAAKLIHNCWGKNQQSALGQFSIGRVGQFSISADTMVTSSAHDDSDTSARIRTATSRAVEKVLFMTVTMRLFPLTDYVPDDPGNAEP